MSEPQKRHQKNCLVPLRVAKPLSDKMEYGVKTRCDGTLTYNQPVVAKFLNDNWLHIPRPDDRWKEFFVILAKVQELVKRGEIEHPIIGDKCMFYADGLDQYALHDLAEGLSASSAAYGIPIGNTKAVTSLIIQAAIVELIKYPIEQLYAMEGRAPHYRNKGIPTTPNDTRAKTLESMRGSIDEMEASLARMKAAYNELAGLDR